MALFSLKDLLLVLTASNALINFVASIRPSVIPILITNDSKNTSLTTQCVANGKVVATTSIPPSGKQAFECTVLDENETSAATCEMSLGKLYGRFDVFHSGWLQCGWEECLWHIDEAGFFFEYEKQLMKLQAWPKPADL